MGEGRELILAVLKGNRKKTMAPDFVTSMIKRFSPFPSFNSTLEVKHIFECLRLCPKIFQTVGWKE